MTKFVRRKFHMVLVVFALILSLIGTGCGKEVAENRSEESEQFESFVAVVEESEEVSEEETSEEEESEEPSEEVSEDAGEEESEEVSEEASEAEAPSEEKEDVPAFTVTDMAKTMYVQKRVSVRDGASTSYKKIGSLNQNDMVEVTGQASTGWYRINYGGAVGYCSDKYLGDTQVVASVPAAPEEPAGGNGNGGGDGVEGIDYVIINGVKVKIMKESTLDHYEVICEWDMFNALNDYRAANGLPALTWDSSQEANAKERVQDILINGGGHGNPTHLNWNGEVLTPQEGMSALASYQKSTKHNAILLGDFSTACAVTAYAVMTDGTKGGCTNIIMFWN